MRPRTPLLAALACAAAFAAPFAALAGEKIVKTGDYTNITRWVAIMLAAGVLLIILAIFSKKKDRKESYNEKH